MAHLKSVRAEMPADFFFFFFFDTLNVDSFFCSNEDILISFENYLILKNWTPVANLLNFN